MLQLQQETSTRLAAYQKFEVLPGLYSACTSMLAVARETRTAALPKPRYDVVFVSGESGTGKEIVGKAIWHFMNDVRHGNSTEDLPFVHVHVAAIPKELMASELFGHKRGSFTGAIADTQGLFRQAQGGVLFLDEIGDLSLETQVYLLDFLQNKRVRSIGASGFDELRVKIVLGTHRNLQSMIQKGTFREDLYFRIARIQINIPPLRARIEDVELLSDIFLLLHSETEEEFSFYEDARDALIGYSWPGNVRELENSVVRAMHNAECERRRSIHACDFELRAPSLFASGDDVEAFFDSLLMRGVTFLEAAQEYRKAAIRLLRSQGWSVSRVARKTGVDRLSVTNWKRTLSESE